MRQASFSGRGDGAQALAAYALEVSPSVPGEAILDLGCGTGELALALLRQRPDAHVTGVDFSAENVAAARTHSDAVRFVDADYLAWTGEGPFDLIVADSVLHLIDGPLTSLAAKLALDLAPGGLLVATVPDGVLRNRLLLLLRRFYRLLPAGPTDRLAAAAATRLHPGLTRQAILDRLPYMRMLPRLFGSRELEIFRRAGLELERNQPWPSLSLAKPRHRLMVWRRR